MARVLVIANAVRSHFYCMVPLAWALRGAGHDVRVAVPPRLVPVVEAAGLVALPVGTDLDLGALPRVGAAAKLGTHGEAARRRMAETGARFVRYGDAMADDLLDHARRWRPHLVVHEPTAIAGPLVATALDVPSVCHRWGVDVGRAVVEAAEAELVACYDRVGVPYRGFDSDFVVDPCPPTLQLPGLPPAQPVRFVAYGGGGKVPPTIPRYGDRPRVLVTVGTVAGPMGGDTLVRRLTDALLGVGLQVVIAVLAEQRAALGELPDGVVAMESYPLGLLAEQVEVAVHHGGGTTMLSCLEAGLPQLAVPYLGDTLENAARLAVSGAGIRVPFADCTPERVADGVRSLLNDPSYRAHALRLRDEMRSAPTVAAVADTLAASVTQAVGGRV